MDYGDYYGDYYGDDLDYEGYEDDELYGYGGGDELLYGYGGDGFDSGFDFEEEEEDEFEVAQRRMRQRFFMSTLAGTDPAQLIAECRFEEAFALAESHIANSSELELSTPSGLILQGGRAARDAALGSGKHGQ